MTIVQSLFETMGVLLLAAIGVAMGGWAARKPWPRWLASYGVPLVLLVMIAVARWVPLIEYRLPLRWIMADRIEFALQAFIATSLLTSPLAKVPRATSRVLSVVSHLTASIFGLIKTRGEARI